MNPFKLFIGTVVVVCFFALVIVVPSDINRTEFCESRLMEKTYDNGNYYCIDIDEMKMYRIRAIEHEFIWESKFVVIKEVVTLE